MPDRISSYRSARLLIFPSQLDTGQASWALVLETVRGGIPHGSVEARGVVPLLGATPLVADIWEAIHDLAGCPWAPPLEPCELDEVPGAPGRATGADPEQLLLPGTDPV